MSTAVADDKAATEQLALKGYLYGQLANVFKIAIWWSGSSPVVIALLQNTSAIAAARVAFNGVMLLLSPIAGVVVERGDPKRLLIVTTILRFFVWSVGIPLCWYVFDYTIDSFMALYVGVVVLFALDGGATAFANVLDMDMGGLGVVAASRNIEIDESVMNDYNSQCEIGLSMSFIFIAPAMAFIGSLVKEHAISGDMSASTSEAGALVIIFMAGFFVFSATSIFFYSWIPAKPTGNVQEASADSTVAEKLSSYFSSLKSAYAIILAHRPIFWRMFFFALEMAIEDAFMVVVVPQYAYHAHWLGGGNAVATNIWSSLIIASGKVGAFVAAYLMMSRWSPPTSPQGYLKLFWFVLLGSIFMGLLPVSYYVGDVYHAHFIATALMIVCSVGFFAFSTVPKLGFMTLFQSMVAKVDASGTVFAWLTVCVLITDAMVIVILSLVGQFLPLFPTLCLTASLYICHGIIECFIGPSLVLKGEYFEGSDNMVEPLLSENSSA
ncbi:hypothetical protein CYMTET_51310 [Cymbomonas tetramitiformis]|uniref:Uncharacterized protein n=1 Tax=Cymbomonas tetramitiformis TaxID=36881 RepID=A0AAE0BLH4_9CHLO|nr:hypothetical protein CYMTET_51310 [Cymbomonas tetramitiformis]|eukprot:gene5025-6125_t